MTTKTTQEEIDELAEQNDCTTEDVLIDSTLGEDVSPKESSDYIEDGLEYNPEDGINDFHFWKTA